MSDRRRSTGPRHEPFSDRPTADRAGATSRGSHRLSMHPTDIIRPPVVATLTESTDLDALPTPEGAR